MQILDIFMSKGEPHQQSNEWKLKHRMFKCPHWQGSEVWGQWEW